MEIKDLSSKWAAVIKEIKTKYPKNKDLLNEAQEVGGMLAQFFARGDVQQVIEGPLEKEIKNTIARADKTSDALSDCTGAASRVDRKSLPAEYHTLVTALDKELNDFIKGIKIVKKALDKFQSTIG